MFKIQYNNLMAHQQFIFNKHNTKFSGLLSQGTIWLIGNTSYIMFLFGGSTSWLVIYLILNVLMGLVFQPYHKCIAKMYKKYTVKYMVSRGGHNISLWIFSWSRLLCIWEEVEPFSLSSN